MKTLTTRTQTPSQTQAEPTNLILAIDLGKYKSVACLHEPASGEVQFTTFVTSIENLTRLLEAKIGRTVYHLWRKQVPFDAKRFLAS